HWKNESARPWRLLGSLVCASLPNRPPQASPSDDREGHEMNGCRPATWLGAAWSACRRTAWQVRGGTRNVLKRSRGLLWRRRPRSKCRHGLVIHCNQRPILCRFETVHHHHGQVVEQQPFFV